MVVRIKAIFFDLDGVLVDAADWHYRALNMALAHFKVEIGRLEHLRTFNGLPTQKKLDLLSSQNRLDHSFHKVVHELKQLYTKVEILLHSKPNKAVVSMLSNLRGQGYSLAVCSNSIRSSILSMLEQAEIIDFFDLVLSAQDVLKPKPYPDIYIEALKTLGCDSTEAIALEDSKFGIESARLAGLAVLKINDVSEVKIENINRFIETRLSK